MPTAASRQWARLELHLRRTNAKPGSQAALAALLLEAPQCLPFDGRVELLRSLIQADKAA